MVRGAFAQHLLNLGFLEHLRINLAEPLERLGARLERSDPRDNVPKFLAARLEIPYVNADFRRRLTFLIDTQVARMDACSNISA